MSDNDRKQSQRKERQADDEHVDDELDAQELDAQELDAQELDAQELDAQELEKVVGGAGSRPRTLDHIGNYNFKVEIDGVTTAAIYDPDADDEPLQA